MRQPVSNALGIVTGSELNIVTSSDLNVVTGSDLSIVTGSDLNSDTYHVTARVVPSPCEGGLAPFRLLIMVTELEVVVSSSVLL